jgi:hypothetical protein
VSNLVKHAERELEIMGGLDEEYNRIMADALLEIVRAFAKQGHSGFSASYAIGALQKLLAYEPLTPLKGTDDEWCEVSPGLFQNKRCGHVFRENGEAYDSEGRIFRNPDGTCYQNGKSRVPVTFPYTPKRDYIDVI